MKQFYLLGIFLLINGVVFATTFTTNSDGDWNNPASWDANGSPGTYWGASDVVIINHDITLNVSPGFNGSMTINSSGSLIGATRNLALYNGASFVANGEVSIQNFTVGSTSTAIHSEPLTVNNLTVGNNSSLTSNAAVTVGGKLDNNGGTVLANGTYAISGNLTNNNGTITFNEATNVGGKFDNNNSSAVININNSFNVTGNIQNNSSATINIDASAIMTTGGNLTNNSGSEVNSDGRINADGNFQNNGGTVDNNGIFDLGGNFTQNGGTFTNNGGMIVDGSFTINGSGTVEGSGVLRVDDITNHGTFNGTVDVCRQDDSTPTTTGGSGDYNVNLTYCTESSAAALPIVLQSITANYIKKNTIEISWLTSSELNNDYFTVSYSLDGIDFIPFEKVLGAGNSNEALTYRVLLNNVTAKEVYIQLKQTDFDGKFELFDPIIAKRKLVSNDQASEELFIYPNPGNGNVIHTELKGFETQEYEIHVLDRSGKTLISKSVFIEEGNDLKEIELLQGGMQLKKGIYFIRVFSANKVIVEKHIVQ